MAWSPQPGPQAGFVTSKVFEVVYGGARGGGKTDAALGDFALHAAKFGADAKGLLARRTRVALEPTIARAKLIFGPQGALWNESRSLFAWPGGARLYFRHLDRDSDADRYQGHDYSRVYVEELTQFATPRVVDKLKATLRSAGGAEVGLRATCNPGGPGHHWVKARYIDAGAETIVEETFVSPFDGAARTLDRLFIPARLTDNPALLAADPDYVARLAQSGSAALVKAWLEGDWNTIEGAFFDKWSAKNIVAPFEIPRFWTRFRSFDWGYASPFSVGWWAVASDDHASSSGFIPRGALVRYREWYGRGPQTGEGPRLEAEAIALGILEREAGETVSHGVADPSIFRQDGGASHGERMARVGVRFRRADNTRVGRAGALSGWDQMRARIVGDGKRPMLYVFDTCRDFIRTVPTLPHDRARIEDLDTETEDHIADEARYACSSRPLIARAPAAVSSRSEWERNWGGAAQPGLNWKTM